MLGFRSSSPCSLLSSLLTFPPCSLIAGPHTSLGMHGTPASLHPLSMRPRAVTTWAQSTEQPNARRQVGFAVVLSPRREFDAYIDVSSLMGDVSTLQTRVGITGGRGLREGGGRGRRE